MNVEIDVERQPSTVVDQLLCVNAQLTRLMDAAIRQTANISLPWFMVLASLDRSREGHMNMTELASQISLSSSGATRLIDRVEEAGYVERLSCASDRRVWYVKITPLGEAVLRKAVPAYRRSVDEYLSGRLDPDELQDLDRLMAKLHGRIEESGAS